jgi:hypothetical protein
MSPGFRTTGVYGPCGILEHGQVLAPTVTSSQGIIFEVSADDDRKPLLGARPDGYLEPGQSVLVFQFAFRHFDDRGVLKVRVVSGQIPIVQEVETPIDEAALALYISRKKVYEQAERPFNQRVGIAKRFVGENSALPMFLFAGSIRDPGFVVGASVERFALSVLVTDVGIGERDFKVIWGEETTLVLPKAEEAEENVLRETARRLGVGAVNFFYPESEEEFRGMHTEAIGAAPWFGEIRAPLAVEDPLP